MKNSGAETAPAEVEAVTFVEKKKTRVQWGVQCFLEVEKKDIEKHIN